jgi:uncharacterized protein YlxP (DUF503 family)
MATNRLHHGLARLDLHLPGAASLKDRRQAVRRVSAALKGELGCSVADLGPDERWQRAVLGIAVAASSATGVERVLERIVPLAERDPRVEVVGCTTWQDALDEDD